MADGRRPRVGIGVLVVKDVPGGEQLVLVGKRKGSAGEGTWALPGGHLEHGESFEQCAAREVLEETGLELGASSFAYAINCILPDSGAHYVTIFMLAAAPPGAEPATLEPDKCEGWSWVPYGCGIPKPRFLPLQLLLDSPYRLRV